ncbi:homocysteine S-methyltransferase family protein [Acuticoccus sp. M5D2P5]|uniref:homocysteine S-methyltransferase family protein n=1 Tax=Acuticoccus kalidii TaxID=2910977 RepID=UPI001F235F7F|nr:homocysteine S-methyltransferase family protein [Acuticoccus kalidii]MCF3933822.1 homocysteine S-methyltransferase family protein [Acuticoccus kalidii]
MTKPLQQGVRYLTDSGLETTLVFHDGRDLPAFAAFPLILSPGGRARLRAYYREHADLAMAHGTGFVFETPTWRANTEWGATIGYSQAALDRVNRESVIFLKEIRDDYRAMPTAISGQIGPRGDGYVPGRRMSADEAAAYHAPQIAAFREADMVTALTINTVDEAVGIVEAATMEGLAVVISFTTETDGRLPGGESLAEAIEETDRRTDAAAAYFMVNCAHPRHFVNALGGASVARIGGVRANASMLSHAELDRAERLDTGDPHALAEDYEALARMLPSLQVFGGCCGTDARHVRCIAERVAPVAA